MNSLKRLARKRYKSQVIPMKEQIKKFNKQFAPGSMCHVRLSGKVFVERRVWDRARDKSGQAVAPFEGTGFIPIPPEFIKYDTE